MRNVAIIWLTLAAAGLSAESQPALPAISHVSENADSGSSLVIVGENFGPSAEVWLWRPAPATREAIIASASLPPVPLPAVPPAGATKAQLLGTPASRILIASNLGDEPALSDDVEPVVAWVRTGAGVSKPWLINRPHLVFLSDPEVLPGQRLRLFGRSLAKTSGVHGAEYEYVVAFQGVAGKPYFGKVIDLDPQERMNTKPFVLQVLVPRELPPGSYTVRVHVLRGGLSAWSNALSLSAVAGRDVVSMLSRGDDYSAATPNAPLVRKPVIAQVSGLNADGYNDDSAAIQSAIDRVASQGGGVVVLPQGNLAITRTIHVRPGVVLRGGGRAATQLVVAPGKPLQGGFPFSVERLFNGRLQTGPVYVYGRFVKEGTAMLWLDDHSGVLDLSIVAGAGCNTAVFVGADDPQKVLTDTFLRRVEISNRHEDAFHPPETVGNYVGGIRVVSATRGFTLAESTIIAGNPLWLNAGRKPHRYARIEGNVFKAYPANLYDDVFLSNVSDSVFEDNEIVNGRRALSSQKGFSRNWVTGNVMHEISGVANGCEIMMSELGGMFFKAGVARTEGQRMTFDTPLGWEPGEIEKSGVLRYAYILSGRGAGQYREVEDNTSDAVVLDHPWAVVPDKTSQVAVMRAAVENFYIANRVFNTRGAMQFFYGAAFDNVIAGNEAYNASDMILWALVEKHDAPIKYDFMPVAYNLVLDNRMTNSGGILLNSTIDSPADFPLYEFGSISFGNIVRRSQVWSKSVPAGANQYWNARWVDGSDPSTDAAFAITGAYNVVESCFVYNSPVGVSVTGGRGNVVRNNMFSLVGKSMDPVLPASTFVEGIKKHVAQ